MKPTPYGYVYAGFTVDPPRRAPFVRPSRKREEMIARLTGLARQLDQLPQVVRATVFRAVFMPPIKGAPRFDVVMLIRTASPEAIAGVQSSDAYAQLHADTVIPARNTRRIGVTETDTPGPGAYLFNHFTGDDPQEATAAWESVTGWYLAKTGVDNSTLLQPFGTKPYAIINYVRLPTSPPRFLLNQLLRPTFHSAVRATLRRHHMSALPVFFRPVGDPA